MDRNDSSSIHCLFNPDTFSLSLSLLFSLSLLISIFVKNLTQLLFSRSSKRTGIHLVTNSLSLSLEVREREKKKKRRERERKSLSLTYSVSHPLIGLVIGSDLLNCKHDQGDEQDPLFSDRNTSLLSFSLSSFFSSFSFSHPSLFLSLSLY